MALGIRWRARRDTMTDPGQNNGSRATQKRRLRPRGEEAHRARPDRRRRQRRRAESPQRAVRQRQQPRRPAAAELRPRKATATQCRRRRASISTRRCGATPARYRPPQAPGRHPLRSTAARQTSRPVTRSHYRFLCPRVKPNRRQTPLHRSRPARSASSSNWSASSRSSTRRPR